MKGQNSSRHEFTVFHVPDLYLDVFSFYLSPFCISYVFFSDIFPTHLLWRIVKVSLKPVRFLFGMGGNTSLYDCYDCKDYIAIHVVAVEAILIAFSRRGGLFVL